MLAAKDFDRGEAPDGIRIERNSRSERLTERQRSLPERDEKTQKKLIGKRSSDVAGVQKNPAGKKLL